MASSFSNQQHPTVETIRALLPEITASAAQRDASRQLPYEYIQQLVQAGIGQLTIPKHLGGTGLSWRETASLLIDLAAADSAIPQALRSHFTFIEDALDSLAYPEDTARHAQGQHVIGRVLTGQISGNAWTEPGDGGTATIATPTDYRGVQGYRISGTKAYTTGSIFGQFADLTAKHAETGQALSVLVPLSISDPEEGQVTVSDDWQGFGQRVSGSGTAVFTDVFVAEDQVKPFNERIGFQTGLYQLFLLIVLAGIARGASNQAAQLVAKRTRNYSHATEALVRNDPQNLAVIGEVSSLAFVAATAVEEAAGLLDSYLAQRTQAYAQALAPDQLSHGSQRELEKALFAFEKATAQTQVVLSQAVPQAATRIFDALGASATHESLGLDRHWRNARTVASHNPWIYKARQVGDHEVNGSVYNVNWEIGINHGKGSLP